MAKQLTTASVATGQTIEAGHVTQSSVAFTGGEAYDITISGSLTTTGTNIMSSSASPSITSILTENDSHPFITGATTTGPNFRMNLADANASGSAYMAFGRQTGGFGGTGFSTSYTTGSNASQGEIIMTLGKNGPLGSKLDRFIVQSEPGPIASNTDSELTLAVGSSTFSRRIVQGLVQNGTNDSAEFVAGNQDATPGYKKHVLMSFTFNNTSSVAGFASSSLNTGSTARNFNANSIPFGIVAGGLSTAELADTAFFVDRGGSLGSILPVTASFEISRGGSINMEGSITASGNVSASGDVFGVTGSFSHLEGNSPITVGDIITFQQPVTASGNVSGSSTTIFSGNRYQALSGFRAMGGGDVLLNSNDLPILSHDNSGTPIVTSLGSDDIGGSNLSQVQLITDIGEILTVSGSTVTVGPNAAAHGTEALNVKGNVSSSGFGLFQAGKPIVTHTTNLTASLGNAGFYNIVGGDLTCSISISTAPVGAEYEFFQTSSVGQFLFESASGTTVISKDGNLKLVGQGSAATLKKVATSTFHLVGDLTS